MKIILLGIFLILFTVHCKKDESSSTTDNQEIGQQIGNTMSSIDESGGSSGSFANMSSHQKTYARYGFKGNKWSFFEKAHAASCALGTTFNTCTNNVITRTFNSCTIGSATFDGSVTLTYTDAAVDGTCSLAADGNSISRNPNFTMTGRRGATLTVQSLGANTQTVTRASAGSFTFTNTDGIRRYFTFNGSNLFDFTTKVDQAMTVTGTSRANRTLTGGNVNVTNNLTGETCDLAPSSVTWETTCNCATSGSWSGTCSAAGAVNLIITGCGTASLTVGSATENVTFDRCYSTI